MKKLIPFFSLLIVNYSLSIASVHYVSHSGSSTPPYLTWETAADSIMSAINISSFGDTIYVANGVYEEQVVMIPGLSLIGAGMDSCIIDTRNFTYISGFYTIKLADSCLLSGFNVLTYDSNHGACIYVREEQNLVINSKIEYNKFEQASYGINFSGYNTTSSHTIISQNIISNVYGGIHCELNQPIILSNYIFSTLFGIGLGMDSNPIIRGNIIYVTDHYGDGIGGGFNNGALILNNTIYTFSADHGNGLYILTDEQTVNNNLIGNFGYGIWTSGYTKVINNTISGAETGIRLESNSPSPILGYNDLWNNGINYQNIVPDSTNLSVNPMFVNIDSMDFHLQKYSPLIDVGDPTILDKDSTRSDIGVYGGPFGESYKYQDLPPRVPLNFSAAVDTDYIVLSWNKNTEADFSHYNLYRDTTVNFTIDSSTFVASVEDTFYLHIRPEGINNLYFKLTAADNQGNVSKPSEELHIVLTGTKTNEEYTINSYRLFQNYPNPFNPSTKIAYRLKERGYVKLYVYDIKGELVQTIVNKFQEGGFYEVEFRPSSTNTESVIQKLASGIYIYQIMVRNEHNIPVFNDIKKMIYLK